MANAPESSRLPTAREDDDDDVAWALQTAMVEWKRGAIVDAIVWLRRAADFAEQLGNATRAGEIAWAAGQIESGTQASMVDEGDFVQSGGFPVAESATADRESDPTPVQPLSEGARAVDDLLDADEIDDADVEDEEEIFEDDLSYESGPLPSFPSPELDEALGGLSSTEAVTQTAAVLPEVDGAAPEIESRYSLLDEDERTDTSLAGESSDAVSVPAVPVPEEAPVAELGDESGEGSLVLEGISLAEVTGFEDLPEEAQADLVRLARVEALATDEETSSFGVALVLKGWVSIMPAIADTACARAGAGEIVFAQGTLSDRVALKVVALEDNTRVAVWDAGVVESKLADCPWVLDELQVVANRLQALAGVCMGVLGERLDDSLRSMVTERCQVRALLPEEVLVTENRPLGGLYVLGAGHLEVLAKGGTDVSDELAPGDILFTEQVLAAGPAPNTVRAGKAGALVLFADRMAAHELMVSVPPLLEILAS